jgi:transcriptional regulator GlxA family with amidase domain
MHPVLPALRHLEVHYADGITLATLAELCNLAPVYFGQRFHQLTGKSPIRYLQETRIKAAAQLLAFSDLSIDEIAHRTGIGTRAYFTRLFSRFIEQSPAAYRRAFRASASRGISLLRPDTNGMERYPE